MTNGILLTQHNQEITQWSPDPFPCERVGSGLETKVFIVSSSYFMNSCVNTTGLDSLLSWDVCTLGPEKQDY